MTDAISPLAQAYLTTGRLPDLPRGHFIDGRFGDSVSGAIMDIVDPGLGRAFTSVAAAGADDVDQAVASAKRGLETWRRAAPVERGRVLLRAATLIRENVEQLALAETLSVGKTLTEARGNVGSAARTFEYYAGTCDKLQGVSIPLGVDQLALTVYEPLGVVAQIIPWNYPLTTFARGVAPALAAGCTVVAKPAETTPLTAQMLAAILFEAGLPAGVCNVLLGTGVVAGAGLAAHSDVAHVTFTGSTATGIKVMQAAATHFASVTMELGGKSPLIALADCDIAAAAKGAVGAIYENAGQICSAGSRLVVERRIHSQLVEAIAELACRLTVGHGLRGYDMGAIHSAGQLQRVADYVDGARRSGSHIRFGGEQRQDPQGGEGWFYAPTLIDDLPAAHPCVQEEIFGPVLAVQVVDSPEEALAAANGTAFGLMAGIYTKDIGAALAIARDVKSGQVTINNYWGGGVEVPFGGVGHSGFGREKGLAAVFSYCHTKSIVAHVPGLPGPRERGL